MTGAPEGPWDVFVSHSHADETAAAAIAAALGGAGLRVFRAVGSVEQFTSISDAVLRNLRDSRVLLACYSAGYPTRPACQYEFATAYLTGQAEGDPLRRVLAVNLERTVDHIEPRHLRDVLLPTPASLPELVKAVSERVAATPGVLGEIPEPAPHPAAHPPDDFTGRWRELWWLHSALHPHVGPLTSRPTAPVVVVHGPAGIGKTALAAQYVRRFGAAFPGGVAWDAADAGPHGLWVLDDVDGDLADVAARLPAACCLVLTRDPRLAKLGTALPLRDLDDDESARLLTTHGVTASPDVTRQLVDATAGSAELRARVAELAATGSVKAALTTLHQPVSPLLAPVTDRLARELGSLDDTSWDVLRLLTAAAPAPVSLLHIADILGSLHDTDRVHEYPAVQHATIGLLARGIVPARPDDVELALPAATVLALRRLDPDPYRAETVRARTVKTLLRPQPVPVPQAPLVPAEVTQAAHRIRTELTHRITGIPLTDGEGSLRDALVSLRELLRETRTVQAFLTPSSLAGTRSGVELSALLDRLIEDVLRPRLTYWHIELGAYEERRPRGVGPIEHERRWPRNESLREDLRAIHREATDIAGQLAVLAGAR